MVIAKELLVLGFNQEVLYESISYVLDPYVLSLIIFGLIIGIIMGAIPGLGGTLGMIIILPLTIYIDASAALILLITIFSGGLYGSSISAILVNVPGTAASAATTFDGYPMTKQGRAWEALEISATASAIGGGLTMVLLLFLLPYTLPLVRAFGSPQVFLLALFGVVMIGAIASQSSLLKGMVSGLFGLLVMFIGISPSSPQVRYNFDMMILFDGLSFIAILIGMFALGEMLRIANREGSIVESSASISKEPLSGCKYVLTKCKYVVVKSSFIGAIAGAIPAVGPSASNFFAYAEQVRSATDEDNYGEGNPKGVAASEASNNSTIAGSLLPVLAFGIPGNAATAVLLGGFVLHGLTPGMEMFRASENLDTTYAMVLALILGNILILFIGLFVITRIGHLVTQIDTDIIIPVVLVFSLIGALELRNNWVDIITVYIFGILAYYMYIYDYSVIALVLGAVLAEVIETNFIRSMQLSGGSPIIFVNDPISLVLVILMIILLVQSVIIPVMKNRRRDIKGKSD